MLLFADISNLQGYVDWSLFGVCGISGVMIKSSQGVWFPDEQFKRNWDAAKHYGLVRKAYHYCEPFNNAGHDDAVYFLNIVKPLLEPGDLTVFDLEQEPNST